MTVPEALDTNATVLRSSGILEAEVDGEAVVLNIDKANCYGLNKVGSRIWQIVAAPSRVDDIVSILLAEYDVDPQTCRTQVLELLEALRAEALITVLDPAGPPP